jgi:ribosomal protein S18 acetylase RimI-like enzyme
MNCICGEQQTGVDADALFAAVRAHSDAAHADLNIPDTAIYGMIAAQERMTPWDGETITLDQAPRIESLTPAHSKDVLQFFDRDAFMDNPIWADCYCYFPHHEPDYAVWDARTAEQNRDAKQALIEQGKTQALLAYAGDRMVGWCHAAPRVTLPMFDRRPGFDADDADQVGSIVCFIVAAPYRGQGIARTLMEEACDHLRTQGLAIVEAYPPEEAGSAARAHLGTVAMYESAGFARHREAGQTIIMRRALR